MGAPSPDPRYRLALAMCDFKILRIGPGRHIMHRGLHSWMNKRGHETKNVNIKPTSLSPLAV